MTLWRKLTLASLVLGIGYFVDIDFHEPRQHVGIPSLHIGPADAQADQGQIRREARRQNRRVARRTARRTSRRTSRRHDYYNSLPAGCPRRAGYYYCGGVYYEPTVRGGETVYVIVNP